MRMIRHIGRSEKTLGVFDRIHVITEAVFKGIENPPDHVLNNAFVNADVFLAEQDNKIVGYAFVKNVNHEPFIWSIAVDPTYQKRGAGGELLMTVENWAKKNKKVHIDLTVKIDNAVAQRLYLKNGYKIRRIIEGFYGNEGDGVVMRRSL